MAEVKSSPNGYLGLFATEAYKAGDTILSELHPLVRLAPASDDDSVRVQKEWNGDGSTTLWESIRVPDSITSPGTFKGMVQAGILWMKYAAAEATRQKILQLYFPDQAKCSEEEKSAMTLSEHAVSYVKDRAAKSNEKIFSTFGLK